MSAVERSELLKVFRPSMKELLGMKDLVGAEVGVYKGHNAKMMLEKLDIKKLYVIDNWSKGKSREASIEDICRKRLEKYSDKIVWLIGDSGSVAKRIQDGELDFVYIDGNHKKPGITKDINAYYPKVKKGGLVSGHDYQISRKTDVRAVIDKFFKTKKLSINSAKCHPNLRELLQEDWWVWKK